MSQERRLRVVLADDHAGVLHELQRLLEPSCEIIEAVRDGRALLEAVASLKPDVVVVDISMPAVNGLDACRQIKQGAPKTLAAH